MQNKADLGKRYTCFNCGGKFYDLNRPEAVCPKCGADQATSPLPDPRVAVMSKYKAEGKKKDTPYQANLDDTSDDADKGVE